MHTLNSKSILHVEVWLLNLHLNHSAVRVYIFINLILRMDE